MAEVLSQSEVESLLTALEPSASSAPKPVAQQRSSYGNQISVYDFKRPERVSKDQMRAFQALHEGFSREFGASLSGLLRSIVEVKLISVDQLTYSEFVFSLENPTCFNLLESKGLEGHLILDLNPSIVFPILDRLLGGGKTAGQSMPGRPITEIEQKLITRITELAMRSLENAWQNICDLKLRIAQIESNPQLVQIVPPNEVTVLISFEIMLGEIRGIVNLCIPFNTIEPLAGKLSSDSWTTYTKKTLDKTQRAFLETGLQVAKVELVVSMASTELRAGELINLNVGDVIVTERDQAHGVEVHVEGRPVFTAKPGTWKGRKAVEITGKIKHSEDFIAERLGPEDAAAFAMARANPTKAARAGKKE